MTKHSFKKPLFILITFMLCLALAIPASAASAKKYPNGALTPPPPESDLTEHYVSTTSSSTSSGEMTINSTWSSSDIYLSHGTVSLSDAGGGNVSYQGITYATQIVSTVGVQLTVQRWTGSYWINVVSSPDFVYYNDISASGGGGTVVAKGYYYRTVGNHWVDNNGRHESGMTYGPSILVNK